MYELKLDRVYSYKGLPVAFVCEVLNDVKIPSLWVTEGESEWCDLSLLSHLDIFRKPFKKGDLVLLSYQEVLAYMIDDKVVERYPIATKYRDVYLEKEWGYRLGKGYKTYRLILKKGNKNMSIDEMYELIEIEKDGELVESWLKEYSCYLKK